MEKKFLCFNIMRKIIGILALNAKILKNAIMQLNNIKEICNNINAKCKIILTTTNIMIQVRVIVIRKKTNNGQIIKKKILNKIF